MNSWDNPRSKNFIATLPDHLLVWGEESKIEAQEFIGMKKKNITIYQLIILDKMMLMIIKLKVLGKTFLEKKHIFSLLCRFL